MTDQSYQFPRFYVTAPSPCPYLEGREERKVFTDLHGPDATELNETLGRVGFRRSQSVAYRPACEGCNACLSVRVIAHAFEPSRSMRRILNKNRDLIIEANDTTPTSEQYELLNKYLATRHMDGGMTDMDEFEFADMVASSPVNTSVVEYREPPKKGHGQGKLVAAALTDVMSDGLSMVYSFFDTDSERPSLGTTMIIDHIHRTAKAGLPYVYLGYYVKESPKMAYKAKFQPMEVLSENGWARMKV